MIHLAEHIFFNGKRYTKEANGYYKSSNKRLHVAIWEATNGSVPEGFDVHHIDDDKSNNSLANLQLISHSEHAALHMNSREPVELTCIQCGKNFFSIHDYAKFCSTKCDRQWRTKQNRETYREKRICERCGKIFETYKYNNVRFCSLSCANSGRQSEKRIPNDIRNNIRTEYIKGDRQFGIRALAKKYDVSTATIWRIVNEK